MNGVLEVQSRMAAIQARFAVPGSGVPAAGGVLGGTPPVAGDFATELARAAASTPATLGAPATPATGSGAEVLAAGLKHLGVPYVWGGTDPRTGLDCSGLTQLAFRAAGIELPRVSRDQAKVGTAVSGLANAQPGDLVFFGSPVDHVGIYLGNDRMLHAPKPGKVVEISEVYETPSAIRRVLPGASAAPAAAAPYAALFAKAEAATGVPARVLAAVASAESGFDPKAVSPAGARGLMQLMPGTARELGVDPMNPASAVDGAARLLARHLREFGSLPLALAAYNAGAGAVARAGGIPPYPETQAYVQKILRSLGGVSA